MLIGVPKEIKNHEYRIGLTPAGVKELCGHSHHVMVEHNGGLAIGFDNEQYLEAGAEIVASAEEIFSRAQMIIKVKEPHNYLECESVSDICEILPNIKHELGMGWCFSGVYGRRTASDEERALIQRTLDGNITS